jgi:hypothetical protein
MSSQQQPIDRMIADLVSDCAPVTPIASPGKNVVVFSALAFLWSGVMLTLLGRRELASVEDGWFWVLEMSIIAVTGIVGIWGALSLAIPGAEIEKPWRWSWYGLAAWIGLLLTGTVHSVVADGHGLIPVHLGELMCVFWMSVFTLGPAALLAHTVQKGFPTCRREAAMSIMLAGSVWSALGIEMHCTHESAQHHFLFHLGPVVLATVIGWFLGGKLLRRLG